MSQEIVYTSAPQGLKPGSQGFCTVVSTEGMARNLADRLESLSGYRHAFAVTDERSYLNPVNYAHVLVSITGRPYHVLSRICDAGFDYSKRSNKLAHHIALADSEALVAPGGPAWAMTQDGFFVTSWDGRTKIIASGRLPRHDDRPASICAEWLRLTGDAGWGGVLAETAESGASQPAYVIFAPGTDVLPLVVESLALLPADQRWKTTYSTYFTKAPAGVQIQWRFLLDGTQEASAQRRNPHVLLIDLCSKLGQATGGPLVGAARSGKIPKPAAPVESLSGSSARLRAWTAHGKKSLSPSTRADQPATLPPVLPSHLPSAALEAGGVDLSRYSRRRHSGGLRKLALGLAASLLAIGLVTIGVLAGMRYASPSAAQGEANAESPPVSGTDKYQAAPRRNTRPPHPDDAVEEPPVDPDKSTPDVTDAPQTASREEPGSGATSSPPADVGQDVTNDTQESEAPDGDGTTPSEAADSATDGKAVPPASTQPSPQAAADVSPFERISIPKLTVSDMAQVDTEPHRLEPQLLVSRDVRASGGPTLMLVGDPLQLLNENEQLSLKWDAGSSSWQVEYDTLDGAYFGDRAVGRFIMDGDGLAYQWEPNLGRGIDTCLRWSLLDITGQGSTKRYLLNRVVSADPVTIQEKDGFRADVIVQDFAGRRPGAALFADVSLSGVVNCKAEHTFRIPIDGVARFLMARSTRQGAQPQSSCYLNARFARNDAENEYLLAVELYYWPIESVAEDGSVTAGGEPLRYGSAIRDPTSERLKKEWAAEFDNVKQVSDKLQGVWKDIIDLVSLSDDLKETYGQLRNAQLHDEEDVRWFKDLLTSLASDVRRSAKAADDDVASFHRRLQGYSNRRLSADEKKDAKHEKAMLDGRQRDASRLHQLQNGFEQAITVLDSALNKHREIERIKAAQSQLTNQLEELAKGKLLYRVYANVDGEKITMVETTPPPPSPPRAGGA